MRSLVAGAGVIGLTTALELARAGHDVTIQTEARTPDTTSDVAAAVWYPFLAEPRNAIVEWSRVTYHTLLEQAQHPGAGVDTAEIRELFDGPPADPWWQGAGPSPELCEPAELPEGYRHGWRVEVPVLDMSRYLPWLEGRAREAGVGFEETRLETLETVAGDWTAIVNCTGLGARQLVGDEGLVPVRGHVLHVDDPGLEAGYIDQSTDNAIAYAIPVGDRVVLGGTAQRGEETLAWPEGITKRILEVNRSIEPRLAEAEIRERKVGLRPYRSPVRLERERSSDGTPVVHNYGHGGSGVTVAWGCARQAARLADAGTDEAIR